LLERAVVTGVLDEGRLLGSVNSALPEEGFRVENEPTKGGVLEEETRLEVPFPIPSGELVEFVTFGWELPSIPAVVVGVVLCTDVGSTTGTVAMKGSF
jgi:hypothetical protein